MSIDTYRIKAHGEGSDRREFTFGRTAGRHAKREGSAGSAAEKLSSPSCALNFPMPGRSNSSSFMVHARTSEGRSQEELRSITGKPKKTLTKV